MLEPLGEIAIKGKREPVHAYRLVELGPVAPAFEQRQDARLVGRKRELAALRRVLKRSADGSEVRVAVVVGSPGVGKSRLAAELTGRAKGVTALWGRCLSYGEGITYWPLREALERAAESAEREAVLDALDADTPPPAPEIAWLFRQFCEATARERPLVLVLDDVHWAEPTFLELVEHLADKGTGAIAVVCLAREELLEDRPSFLEGRANASRIVLDALAIDETDALLDGLGGTVLESDQRARIVEAAEGNPLFLEQLLALALEGGLAERELPETIQALLAARLDRLGPGERAVLERGAVIGKEFRLDDVVALIDPEAAPTTEVHLNTLAARGFVRPAAPGEFRFRHVLVQEAVYRAAPKRLRAELHERFIDRFEGRLEGSAALAEFAGYHLEQAYRLRSELGESDRHTAQLAEDAGRRLGEAGFGALKRGDMPATVNLLDRATALLPLEDETRHELMSELGIAQYVAGDPEAAHESLVNAIAGAERAGQRRVELRARIEAAYLRLLTEPEGAARDLLAVAQAAVPAFEAIERRQVAGTGLAAHRVCAGWDPRKPRGVGGSRGACSRRTTGARLPGDNLHRADCGGALLGADTRDPGDREMPRNSSPTSRSASSVALPRFRIWAACMRRRVASRRLASSSPKRRRTYEELGSPTAVIHCGTVRADLEFLAADFPAAEQTLREQCDYLELTRDRAHLSVRAAKLADAIYRQGTTGRGRALGRRVSLECGDRRSERAAGTRGRRVEAPRKERGGNGGPRVRRRDRAARREHGRTEPRRGDEACPGRGALASAQLHAEAERAIEEAIALFEQKGNSVAESQARDLLSLVPA